VKSFSYHAKNLKSLAIDYASAVHSRMLSPELKEFNRFLMIDDFISFHSEINDNQETHQRQNISRLDITFLHVYDRSAASRTGQALSPWKFAVVANKQPTLLRKR